MIYADGKLFLLQTENISYMFRLTESGHLEHLHFGGSLISKEDYARMKDEIDLESKDKEILRKTADAIAPKHFFGGGNMNYYSDEHSSIFLEQLCLEHSSFGKGDIREPMVELTYADGSSTVDFTYHDYKIYKEKKALLTMPSSYDDTKSAQQLHIIMKDKGYGSRLDLVYTVFPDCDVITRSAAVYNESKEKFKIERLLSASVDFNDIGYKLTSFHGRWADEMGRSDSICRAGKVVCEELAAGESGSRSNPFVIVSEQDADDRHGECYGFNLVYSGNHYEALSSNGANMSRFVTGIQPGGFG